MARRDAFDSKKLALLGIERLSGILLDLADQDPAIKRRLKLELASAGGPDDVAAEIRKRLTHIGKARSFIDWHKVRDFAEDLEAQRRAIAAHIAPNDPALACDLLWQFLALAAPAFARCDDSNGVIGGNFALALEDLARAVAAAKPAAADLADRVFAGFMANDFGQYDGLIPLMAEPQALLILPPLWYLVAWDPKRDDFRHFRMDRISQPELMDGAPFRRRHVPFKDDVCPYSQMQR